MKKKIIATVIGLLLIVAMVVTYTMLKPEDSGLQKIRVSEVTHSAFYASLYVAIEDGYFEEEGLEIELILTPGADKVVETVLRGYEEVGCAGEESAIYIYSGEE